MVKQEKELVMVYRQIRVATGAVLLVMAAGLAGCASTSEIESLRSEIRQANETASGAAATADAARKEAAAASQTADEAKAIAEEAKAASAATDAKIDRMFKKSMYK